LGETIPSDRKNIYPLCKGEEICYHELKLIQFSEFQPMRKKKEVCLKAFLDKTEIGNMKQNGGNTWPQQK
jgi:hypothetical protein